jgi:hypothetical protein
MASLFRIISLIGAVWVSLVHIGHHDGGSAAHLRLRRGSARAHVLHMIQRATHHG